MDWLAELLALAARTAYRSRSDDGKDGEDIVRKRITGIFAAVLAVGALALASTPALAVWVEVNVTGGPAQQIGSASLTVLDGSGAAVKPVVVADKGDAVTWTWFLVPGRYELRGKAASGSAGSQSFLLDQDTTVVGTFDVATGAMSIKTYWVPDRGHGAGGK